MCSTITVKPNLENMSTVSEFLRSVLSEWKISAPDLGKLEVSLDEILSNIVSYSGASFVTFSCDRIDGNVILKFIDDGVAFNPLEAGNIDINTPLEQREFGGMGIFIVKNYVDKLEYEYTDCKNILTLYYKSEGREDSL